MEDIILTTTEFIPGYEITEIVGLAQGSCVQTKSFGKDFGAGLKTLVGGEVRAYTDMMNESRQLSTKRMVDRARDLGADAIICVRYSSSAVMQGAAEIMVVGTAVRIRKL
ncbi:MAG: YbjQ family protein [Coprobacillaceae bacterium]